LQHLIGYGLASYPCNPGGVDRLAPLSGWAWVRPSLLALTLAAVLLAGLGGLVSWRSWKATRSEGDQEHHDVLEVGAGRTRWLALSGLLVTGLLLGAILFDAVVLLGAPAC
jgi:hypothetical protein